MFASLNQLDFKATSRLDDLYSLMYLLLYLSNDSDLPEMTKFFDKHKISTSDGSIFKGMIAYKMKYSPQRNLLHI